MTKIVPFILCLLVCASAVAQDTTTSEADRLQQVASKAQADQHHAKASLTFESAYRAEHRAIFLHQAAVSHSKLDPSKWDWALMLAQCARVEKKKPLNKEQKRQNDLLISQLKINTCRTKEAQPKSLSRDCANLEKDARLHDESKSLFAGGFDAKMPDHQDKSPFVAKGYGGLGIKGAKPYKAPKAVHPNCRKVFEKGQKKKRAPVLSKVSFKLSKTTKSCDRKVIKRKLLGRHDAFRFCHVKMFPKPPLTYGDVTLVWQITTQGQVQEATLEKTTFENATVEGCIMRVLKRTKFEGVKEKMCQVQVKFSFKK